MNNPKYRRMIDNPNYIKLKEYSIKNHDAFQWYHGEFLYSQDALYNPDEFIAKCEYYRELNSNPNHPARFGPPANPERFWEGPWEPAVKKKWWQKLGL